MMTDNYEKLFPKKPQFDYNTLIVGERKVSFPVFKSPLTSERLF